MAAQYRPYRDEDSVDGLETTSWTDNEPGTLQIYEKTTEELPFDSNNKRAFWTQIALFILTGLVGFIIGCFGPFHQSDLLSSRDEGAQYSSLEHDLYEDPSIKNKLMAQIDSNNILFVLEKYDKTNRLPGSSSDHEFAQYVRDTFQEHGLDQVSVTNYTFKTMLPKQPTSVALLNKDNATLYSNLLNESYAHDDMRAFLPLSQAVQQIITTSQILYLNKGTKDDYAKLSSLGISTTETEGKVLIIRQPFYQAMDVVLAAQEGGAIAVLLFPEPEIYGKHSPFPKSVQLPDDAALPHPLASSNYGDLVSLNTSATSGLDQAKSASDKYIKVRIPIIPISFKTAEIILRGLSGVEAPKEWNCFDFTLHIGPGYRDNNNLDQRDKIRIEFYNHETELTTSIVKGTIAGAVEPDRYILVGSRRDSLNRGLLDSVSGTATMLEIARVFGNLLKQGWRPRRTIIFSSFGSESLNFIGSNSWLESNHRILHSRAVAYINCDLIVTGNRTVTIAASPLLYQVLYNATKQVANPTHDNSQLHTVYDLWKDYHGINKTDNPILNANGDGKLNRILDETNDTAAHGESKITDNDSQEDSLGHHGEYSWEYKKSAAVKWRPKVRRLDSHSIYSPFFLIAGIPVVDVRFSGYQGTEKRAERKHSDITMDLLPLIGSKYDNLETLRMLDPQLKYHVAVAQVLSEILRDLSDSVFLPFNLLDYAATLHDSYEHFVAQYGKTLTDSHIQLEPLNRVINEFIIAAAKFHIRQDNVKLRDAMQVRKFNDQMMLLERAFLDTIPPQNVMERRHIILSTNDGKASSGFPGMVDWINLMDGENMDDSDFPIFVDILRAQYDAVVHSIANAIEVIEDVHSI